jgi:hypothetical protein
VRRSRHVCASKHRGSAVNKPSSRLTGVSWAFEKLDNWTLGHTWLNGAISPRWFIILFVCLFYLGRNYSSSCWVNKGTEEEEARKVLNFHKATRQQHAM